jgi:hypothetical protein
MKNVTIKVAYIEILNDWMEYKLDLYVTILDTSMLSTSASFHESS